MSHRAQAVRAAAMTMLILVAGAVPTQAANPRALVEDWNEDLAEIREKLGQQEWKKARRGADRLLDNMSSKIRTGDGAWSLYARVLMHRALARAGAGEMEKAEWDWHMTAAFDEQTAWSDLAEFDVAGSRIDAYRRTFREEKADWALPAAPGGSRLELAPGEAKVTPPRKRRSPRPKFPWATRGVEGPTVVQAVIDTDGRLKMPSLLEPQQPTQAYAALETVRRWRFEPATLDGKPVSVYYNLTVNFGWAR